MVSVIEFKRRRAERLPILISLALIASAVFGFTAYDAVFMSRAATAADQGFACAPVRVTDGDTIRCGEKRVRLAGIDAPEMPGHCRQGRACTPGDPYASTENLKAIEQARWVRCRQIDIDAYGRIVARCSAGGEDLSCRQVADGHAVLRYAPISC